MRHARHVLIAACALLVAWVSLESLRAQRTRTPGATSRVEPQQLTDSGGRLDWYDGEAHELIAFDAIVDERTRDTEVFLMNPDGSGRTCVTCEAEIPKGFVGQPTWHPDGEHLIIQVENEHSDHRIYNHVSFGIDNDLWIIRRDGSGAERIWATERRRAALHPHFDAEGTTLVFAERVPTGKRRLLFRRLRPDGENQWAGWRIRVATFDLKANGTAKIKDTDTITPNGEGFYETHGFTSDDRLVYSHTPGGAEFVQDIYTARRDGSDVRDLTTSTRTWDEHGQFSPKGDFAWVSSRFDRSLEFPGARAASLRTELFVRRSGGRDIQLTRMNEMKKRPVVVSDFNWDRDGRRIAFQVAELGGSKAHPEIWLIRVDE